MSQEGSKLIYRVVSQEELKDLEATGRFHMGPCPTYELGKLFAIHYESVVRFKRLLYNLDGIPNTTIVTAYTPLEVYERGDCLRTDGFESILILAHDLRFLERVN